MNCSAIIKTFDPPEKLDSLLDNRLLNYAYVIADLIIENYSDMTGNPYHDAFTGVTYNKTKRSTSEELAFIEKIKRDLLDELHFYSKKFLIDKELEGKSPEERDRVIAERFRLVQFFKALRKRKELLEIGIDHKLLPERRGRPIDIKICIASIWSMVMKESNKVCWSNIVRLLGWFSSRLRGTIYGEDIKMSKGIKDKPKYLKKQCSRIAEKYPSLLEDWFRTYFEPVPEWHMFPRSIEFSMKNIKIGGTWGEEGFEQIKLNFMNGKTEITEKILKTSSKPPQIAFPNGEVYYPPPQT